MRTVQFKHDIGDTVKVRDIGMAGRVDALSLDSNGELYRVVYWNDGNRNQVWMYDWELEPNWNRVNVDESNTKDEAPK